MNCPDLRIALDTSSFEASANGAVFLYFRRSDSETVVAAVESGTVSSLRNISADVSDLANTVALTAELDEALRFIIVSPLATGWLTLWTEPFLEGQSCSINLTNLTSRTTVSLRTTLCKFILISGMIFQVSNTKN